MPQRMERYEAPSSFTRIIFWPRGLPGLLKPAAYGTGCRIIGSRRESRDKVHFNTTQHSLIFTRQVLDSDQDVSARVCASHEAPRSAANPLTHTRTTLVRPPLPRSSRASREETMNKGESRARATNPPTDSDAWPYPTQTQRTSTVRQSQSSLTAHPLPPHTSTPSPLNPLPITVANAPRRACPRNVAPFVLRSPPLRAHDRHASPTASRAHAQGFPPASSGETWGRRASLTGPQPPPHTRPTVAPLPPFPPPL